MRLIRILAVVSAFATVFNSETQKKEGQPSITFGMASISLGMSVEQVEQRLSGASRHLQFLPDKQTAVVYRNGDTNDFEGQITFHDGRASFAQFQMPNANSAEELAQEIAGAVDNMESKSCEVSNYSAHGTGGGFSQSIFECGTRRFDIMTVQTFGNAVRTVHVNIEIGQTINK